jgi:hypothetical protein
VCGNRGQVNYRYHRIQSATADLVLAAGLSHVAVLQALSLKPSTTICHFASGVLWTLSFLDMPASWERPHARLPSVSNSTKAALQTVADGASVTQV